MNGLARRGSVRIAEDFSAHDPHGSRPRTPRRDRRRQRRASPRDRASEFLKSPPMTSASTSAPIAFAAIAAKGGLVLTQTETAKPPADSPWLRLTWLGGMLAWRDKLSRSRPQRLSRAIGPLPGMAQVLRSATSAM
jgi:hypothetical protein